MNIFDKINTAVKNRKTYTGGLLQAKVYRIIKIFTNEKLRPYHISTIEWALIGLLNDNQKGIRPSELAEMLGVESPFVTLLIRRLHKLEIVDIKKDTTDNRVKMVYLTKKGITMVPKIESFIRSEVGMLVEGISHKDIICYLSVLEKIVKNSKNLKIPKMTSLKD